VCVGRGGGTHSLAGSETINEKTTYHCSPGSSMTSILLRTYAKVYLSSCKTPSLAVLPVKKNQASRQAKPLPAHREKRDLDTERKEAVLADGWGEEGEGG
jgi:hypothetical protein